MLIFHGQNKLFLPDLKPELTQVFHGVMAEKELWVACAQSSNSRVRCAQKRGDTASGRKHVRRRQLEHVQLEVVENKQLSSSLNPSRESG